MKSGRWISSLTESPQVGLKCLAIVDDATHEAVAVIPEHAIGGDHLVRLLDEVCAIRGRPSIIEPTMARNLPVGPC